VRLDPRKLAESSVVGVVAPDLCARRNHRVLAGLDPGVIGIPDAGVDDDFAKELAAALEPPRAALVLLVREADGDKVLPEIREYGGHVIRTSLSNEAEASLRARLSAR